MYPSSAVERFQVHLWYRHRYASFRCICNVGGSRGACWYLVPASIAVGPAPGCLSPDGPSDCRTPTQVGGQHQTLCRGGQIASPPEDGICILNPLSHGLGTQCGSFAAVHRKASQCGAGIQELADGSNHCSHSKQEEGVADTTGVATVRWA